MTNSPMRAAIYVRISRDNEGNGLGVARQEDACRKLADRLGWHVVDVYPDNSISAYDRRKKRPHYERMLTDVAAGRVNAVLAYAVDRLTRHPIELERLVDVLGSNHIAVRTVVGGELDLSTEEGLLRARIMGSVARFESGRKSERLRAKAEQMVSSGKRPCGTPRPFGYDRHYEDGKIASETVNEAEAAAIRDAAARLLAGESMRSIIIEWNARGLRSSMGNLWKSTTFRQMIGSPRLAGLLVHNRQPVQGVTAEWPAILDRETHEQLAALIAARKGSGWATNNKRFWLTGHVFCTCGTAMRVHRTTAGKRQYTCLPKGEGGCGGRVVSFADLDELIRRVVIKRTKDPETFRGLAARQSDTSAESAGLVEAIERDERRLAMLQDQLADGEPEEIPEVRAAVRKVRDRIRGNREALARTVGAEPLIGVDVDDLEERWETLDAGQKAALLRVARIARIVIKPTSLRGRFDPGRVVLVPIED